MSDDDLEVTDEDFPDCRVCGKPCKYLERDFGYFCEDRCTLESSKESREQVRSLVKDLMGVDIGETFRDTEDDA